MKYKELRAIVEYLQKHRKIHDISRVDDNVFRIVMDRDEYFFDLNRSRNLIYKRDDFLKTKFYNAPFDKVLAKRCKKAFIEKIELDSNDKIIRIYCLQKGSYKEQRAILQLEFTNRYANAIILDENSKVLEALHHDFHRDIRPGKPLYPLTPPKKLDKSPLEIEDIDAFLHSIYQKELLRRLGVLKASKLLALNKQIKKLQTLLEGLEKEEELEKRAELEEQKANLVLANLNKIRPYQERFEGEDFEGKRVCFDLPKDAKTPAHGANILFQKAKKLRQKAKNIHIQRQNLQEKTLFLKRKKNLVENAKRVEDIEILFPKKASRSESRKDKNYEKFVVEGYPIYVGKNKKGNIELLKRAKASDIWLHLKDIPSAHVIVATNRQNIPKSVLEQAAKLCVDFSVDQKGKYLVDYTQRRHVRPKEGANVEYFHYKTLTVNKV